MQKENGRFIVQKLLRISGVRENGKVGGFKCLSLLGIPKTKTEQNCLNQLCQNSGKQSKDYSNQLNDESGKSPL